MEKIKTNRIEFKTIDQQIDILKRRGLTINDENKVSQYLLTNNYYNIINGYSKYFQISKDSDQYIDKANFDEVSNLYRFDKEIKQTFLNAILDAEHHLKSIVAYRFAEEYKNKNYAYLDINSYSQDNPTDVLQLISKLSNLIKDKIRYKDKVITHYVNEYGDIPIWVLVDFLDFGTLNYVVKNLPKNIQNNIALDLTSFLRDNLELPENFKINPWSPKIMNSFIKNIAETRNVCAHNSRLLNFQCRSDSVYYSPLHDKYNLKNKSQRHSTYSTMISLQCFISKNEYAILNNTLRKRIMNLSNKLGSINIETITNTLGFPNNWQSQQKLIQK